MNGNKRELYLLLSIIFLSSILLNLIVSVTIIKMGPVGPRGALGPQGVQGSKGEKGDIGLTGSQGISFEPYVTGYFYCERELNLNGADNFYVTGILLNLANKPVYDVSVEFIFKFGNGGTHEAGISMIELEPLEAWGYHNTFKLGFAAKEWSFSYKIVNWDYSPRN